MSGADPVNPQALRRGIRRVWHAALISVNGFRAGWREAAFREEVACAVVMVPAAFWVGRSWVEVALLVATVVLVLIVELLNSAIEATVDRIGRERHQLSGLAKDIGSAAVLTSLLLLAVIWILILWR